jgi:pyruvate,water dikinase
MAALAAERERRVAETRVRLHGHPPAVAEQFERLLHAAQVATVLTEDHDYWIDGRGAYQVRRVLMAFGRRFAAADVLDRPDDVFYLTLQEVGETAAAGMRPDRRRLVGGRRAELEYFRTITPPAALGTPPAGPASGPPPEDPHRPIDHGIKGSLQPPAETIAARIVRGTAASPGVARGPAKVVHALVEAAKVQPGDVLVAETTAPPWTPLFATAAAIVTDTGGILSHGAIVAREYGIPAVVGTVDATTRLRDGQLVEVDGSAGVVRVL